MKDELSLDRDTGYIEDWARSKKRVTHRDICEHFLVDEDRAEVIYLYLKTAGVVGSMGYVES